MVCTSGSVEAVAQKTIKAADQVKALEANLDANKKADEAAFFAEIDANLAKAKITDAIQMEYASNMKVEYTSEFSLDKIAQVVVAVLKAVIAAKNPASPTPGMDKEAMEAYVNVVNTVAEAAKSNSQSSSSIAFSMTRLSPGIYAFLFAKSTNILDDDTFGSEEVTATAIYYRVMQSIDDIKNQAKFGLAIIDAKILLDMKALQHGLVARLAEGNIDIDTWIKLDSKYEGVIQGLKDRMAEHGWEETQGSLDEQAVHEEHRQLAKHAATKLSAMSTGHQNIAKLVHERLAAA